MTQERLAELTSIVEKGYSLRWDQSSDLLAYVLELEADRERLDWLDDRLVTAHEAMSFGAGEKTLNHIPDEYGKSDTSYIRGEIDAARNAARGKTEGGTA